MSLINYTIPPFTTLIPADTRTTSEKVLLLPTANIYPGRVLMIKDYYGTTGISSLTISTTGTDSIEDVTPQYIFSNSFGSISLLSDGDRAWRILGLYTGLSTPVPFFPLSASSYLPLLVNSIDSGQSPETVTVFGSVTYTTIGGKQCAYFNNSLLNYLSLPYRNPLIFTLCFWYYPINGTYYTCISITTAGSTANTSPALEVDAITSTRLQVRAALPLQYTVSPTIVVDTVGTWKFVAIVIDQVGFTLDLYVNGVLRTSALGTGSVLGLRNLFFLGRSGTTSRAFNGYLRQFAIFPRRLTSTEIIQYYNESA